MSRALLWCDGPGLELGSGLGLGVRVRVRVRVRCFVVTGEHKWALYGSVAEEGGRGSASGLWLEGRLLGLGSGLGLGRAESRPCRTRTAQGRSAQIHSHQAWSLSLGSG